MIVSADPETTFDSLKRGYQLTSKGFILMILERAIEDKDLDKALDDAFYLKCHNLVYKTEFKNSQTSNWIDKNIKDFENIHSLVAEKLINYSDFKTLRFFKTEGVLFIHVLKEIEERIIALFENKGLNEAVGFYFLKFNKKNIGIDQMWFSLKQTLNYIEEVKQRIENPFPNNESPKDIANVINGFLNEFCIFRSRRVKMENRNEN